MFSERKPTRTSRKESSYSDATLEKRFRDAVARFEKDGTTGDETLDELVSDYIGFNAFNLGAGPLGHSVEEERQEELIKEHLAKKAR